MLFERLKLRGAWLVKPQPISDSRGFFSRVVCEEEFKEHGLKNRWLQQNIAFNHMRGTLRGLHFQKGDAAEIKVVRCTRGSIYDVIVDFRRKSPTYLAWIGVELSAENHNMLYIPEGFAHGYITLTDNAEIFYLVSSVYTPEAEGGLRYDDPKLGIVWPLDPVIISDKDRSWAYLE